MADNSDDILHDFSPMLRHYKDGRIERLMGQDFTPPSLDPTTRVQSKDVQIAPEIPISARLYLPKTAVPGKKLPLLIYFHGGGFVAESAFSAQYQKHLNFLTAETDAVAVSVNYRLAPENPIPAAFEDAWRAIKWTASEAADEWIKRHADLDRVYLGGDSAGANIAHNIAIRFGAENPDGIKLKGIFLNCPFFGGKDPIGSEAVLTDVKNLVEKLWFYACPNLTGLDEPWVNPAVDGRLSELGCLKVLVYVAEKDFLRDRGWHYKTALEKSGWNGEVEMVEVEDEGHVFSVFNPDGENGLAMIRKVASLINDE